MKEHAADISDKTSKIVVDVYERLPEMPSFPQLMRGTELLSGSWVILSSTKDHMVDLSEKSSRIAADTYAQLPEVPSVSELVRRAGFSPGAVVDLRHAIGRRSPFRRLQWVRRSSPSGIRPLKGDRHADAYRESTAVGILGLG